MGIMDWTREHMRILEGFSKAVRNRGTLKGKSIGVVLHLEKKTAFLIDALLNAGADVHCASCNPLTADQEIIDYLKGKGAGVHAKAFATQNEYYSFLSEIAAKKPDAVIDDGADMIELLHKKGIPVIGACEETTTGILRVQNMEARKALRFPVISINDAHSKRLFDNVFGTGESTLNGIMQATNVSLAGKTVAVVGYGHCGKGIAKRLRGMGSKVVVVESELTDRFGYSGLHKAMEAHFDGFQVMDAVSACRVADMIITVTGNTSVIDERHFRHMKDNVILANSGHFNVEIDLEFLEAKAKNKIDVTKSIRAYELEGKRINVLSEGRLVNLAKPAGQGHPIDIMDLSFSIQLLSLEYLLGANLSIGLHKVPEQIDNAVAKAFLENNGIRVEKLTVKQKEYLGMH